MECNIFKEEQNILNHNCIYFVHQLDITMVFWGTFSVLGPGKLLNHQSNAPGHYRFQKLLLSNTVGEFVLITSCLGHFNT